MAVSCCDDVAFIEEQIAAIKEAIRKINADILAASSVQSYSLDTGQTKQSVARQQIASLRATRDGLLNELRYWQNQIGGCSSVYVRPAW